MFTLKYEAAAVLAADDRRLPCLSSASQSFELPAQSLASAITTTPEGDVLAAVVFTTGELRVARVRQGASAITAVAHFTEDAPFRISFATRPGVIQ